MVRLTVVLSPTSPNTCSSNWHQTHTEGEENVGKLFYREPSKKVSVANVRTPGVWVSACPPTPGHVNGASALPSSDSTRMRLRPLPRLTCAGEEQGAYYGATHTSSDGQLSTDYKSCTPRQACLNHVSAGSPPGVK